MRRWFALFYMLAACAGVLRAAEDKEMAEMMAALENTQVIKAGDFLSLQIRKMGLERTVVKVGASGEFQPPFLASMKAAGLTCRALAYDVRRELEKNYLCGTQWVVVKLASAKDVMDVLNDRDIIQPGDKVGLRILESARPPVECVVAKSGTIKVRDLGRIQAAGLTCKKLAHLISQKLAALPPASLSYQYNGVPTVAVAFEVIQPPQDMAPVIPPTLR